jgi:uroporphyrin-III C-methyltransferase/precorrin-2 dehydrogenase/sirohydrochlorin ferrochelatase
MKYLPLFFNITGRRCLVVGGGRIATRRTDTLLRSGAVPDLVAPDIDAALAGRVESAGGRVYQRPWQDGDIHPEYALVVAATDDTLVNNAVLQAARGINLPVNVVTDASASDIAFPSVIEREPFTVAISSGSASPLLARLLGERIKALIPPGYGRLATLVGRYRQQVRQHFSESAQRRRFWERALTGSVAEQVFAGNFQAAEAMLQRDLRQSGPGDPEGEVYLIGAGPGDPDLLTFRAWRLLQQSGVVLYDRLVSRRILDQIHPDAEMIYVGKQRDRHAVPQEDINRLLVEHARAGRRVARLKGGDPFIFGRGGEEIELLAEHRVSFQVVPGITAASGCACYSGIPLTHRDHAQSVRFVTGQLRDGSVDLPWDQLVQTGQTVVIYMGLNGLPLIAKNLVAAGMDPATPAALIEQGTLPAQKVHTSSIGALPAEVGELSVQPPTLLIIGSVVRLHHRLSWYNPDM